jgi:hypothetical protein
MGEAVPIAKVVGGRDVDRDRNFFIREAVEWPAGSGIDLSRVAPPSPSVRGLGIAGAPARRT